MADPAPDLTATIADAAANPASVTVGDRSHAEHPLPDLIEAERFLAGKRAGAAKNPVGGPASAWGQTRPARFVPPGGG